jgi:DNA polymerase III subunit delta
MYLITGPEELLLRRAAEKILDELRRAGDLDVVDVQGGELGEAGLPDLRTASLFGNPRALLVRRAQDLPAGLVDALLEQLDGTTPEATVLLLASGTQRLQRLARRIKELGGRIDVKPPAEWDRTGWPRLVLDEFRRHGRAADQAAVTAVLEHAGTDVSVIAEKVAQVVAAAPAGRIGAAQVDEVVSGHGSRGTFAVADAMCARDPQQALVLLRGALEAGLEPLLILGGLAYRLRSIVAAASGVAGDVGLKVSQGQARHLEAARRNFGPGELSAAFRTLADADVGLKSSDLPAELVIERAVVDIATRR